MRLLCLLATVHALELARHGHPLACAAVLAMGGAAAWAWRRANRPGPSRPRRLLVAADGRLFLHLQGGAVEQARLAAQSLRLGRSLLLVLRGNKTHRLLLGPDNLAAPELAALQRRLPRAGGG